MRKKKHFWKFEIIDKIVSWNISEDNLEGEEESSSLTDSEQELKKEKKEGVMAPVPVPTIIRPEDDSQVDYSQSVENDNQTSSSSFPHTQIVLRLNPFIQPAAVSWLVKKITGKKQDGGAELLVRCEPYGGRRKEVSQYIN